MSSKSISHTCRHWYAIRFLLQGGKLFALQRHLGHETLEMVKMYAHFTDHGCHFEQHVLEEIMRPAQVVLLFHEGDRLF